MAVEPKPYPDMCRLPPDSLDDLARWHRTLARLLEDAARRARAREADSADRARRRAIRAAARGSLVRYLALGLAKPEAVARAAAESGLPATAVEVYAGLATVHEAAAEARRRARNRVMLEMMGRGYTDSEIGARVGLHRKSVNRILKGIRAKAGV